MKDKMKTKRAAMDKHPQIQHGNVELDPDEFAPENTKVRLSMWIDGDVLEAIKGSAKKDGEKYQTWLNRYLRRHLVSNVIQDASYQDLSGAIEILNQRMDEFDRWRKKKA